MIGYIYRPKHDYESDNFFSWKAFSLVMNNDFLYIDEQEFNFHILKRCSLSALESKGYYILEYGYEGNYLRFINRDNEVVFERNDSKILDFDDQKRLFILTIPYGPNFVKLEIINIEEGQFIQEFKVQQDDINIRDIEIISNEEIAFNIVKEDVFPTLLKYKDGEWIMETDYVFEPSDWGDF